MTPPSRSPALLVLALLLSSGSAWGAQVETQIAPAVPMGELVRGPSPSQLLAQAEVLYRNGELEQVQRLLNGPSGILGERPRLLDPLDVHQACELAAATAFFLDDRAQARTWLVRSIRLDPAAVPDPLTTPPALVAFYQEVRAGLSDPEQAWELADVFPELHLVLNPAVRPLGATRGGALPDRLRLVPLFGFGFQQLRAPRAATAVRVMEVITGALSIASWVRLNQLRVIVDPTLNPERYTWRAVNVASFAAFWVTLGIDIIGSLWLHQYRRAHPERMPPRHRLRRRLRRPPRPERSSSSSPARMPATLRRHVPI